MTGEISSVESERTDADRGELLAGQREAVERRHRVAGAEDPNVETRL